jgi:flagellar basal body-associated protein FliL
MDKKTTKTIVRKTKSNSRLAFILFIIVPILLIGGGLGIFFYYSYKAANSTPALRPVPPPAPPKTKPLSEES